MRLLSVCTLFLLLVFSGVGHSARFEVALHNHQNGKFEEAYHQFVELASLGNKDAQFNIGIMYLSGEYVAADTLQAYAWVKLAASKGDSHYVRGLEKFKADLSESEIVRAEAKFKEVDAKYGDDVIALKLMPVIKKNGGGTYSRYRPLLKKAARYPSGALDHSMSGDAVVDYIVGDDGRTKHQSLTSYTHDLFKSHSLKASRSFLYRPATINGKAVDVYGVRNRFIFQIKGAEIDSKKIVASLSKLKEQAINGTSVERYQYANTVSTLRGWIDKKSRREFNDSTQYFSLAAVDGLPQAKFRLGRSILYGEQCDADTDKSYFWLQSAAKDELPEAQMMLGLERFKGVRSKADPALGIELLTAASSTYEPAKIELAMALALVGDDTLRDIPRALSVIQSVNKKEVIDLVSLYEAEVIVYSLLDNKKSYAKSLKRLKKEAKKVELPYDTLVKNITNRIEGRPIQPLLEG